jgi:hypothetical protein
MRKSTMLACLLMSLLSGICSSSDNWCGLDYHSRTRQLLLNVNLNGVSARAAVVLSGNQSYISSELAKKINYDRNSSKTVIALDSGLQLPVNLEVSPMDLLGIDLVLDRDVFADHVLTWDIPAKKLKIGSEASLKANRIPFDYKTGKFKHKGREMWLPLLASVSEEVSGERVENVMSYNACERVSEVLKGKFYLGSHFGVLDLFTGSGAKPVAGATFFGHQTIEIDLIADTISFVDENVYRAALIWKYQLPSLELEVVDGSILFKGHANVKYMDLIREKQLIGAKLAKVGDIVVGMEDFSDVDRFLRLFTEYKRKPELGFEKGGRFFFVQP